MSEELHTKIGEHESKLAKHEIAIDTLIKSTDKLAKTIDSLPEKLELSINKVHERIDDAQESTFHTMLERSKLPVGVLTLIFSVITTL